ncbi:MAG: PAS domain-containing sensor histidine kinase [Candidatus Cyclobacteriaceae bacterium M2_1C_046]
MLSKNHYHSIFKTSPNACLLLNIEGTDFIVAGVNEAYSRIVNVTESDLMGQDLFKAIAKNNIHFYGDGKKFKDSLQQVLVTKVNYNSEVLFLDSGFWTIENVPVHNDTGEVELIVHYPVKKASGDLFKEKAEPQSFEELLQIKEHYKCLFDHDPDGLCIIDLEGKFLTVNKSFERIAEGSRETLYQMSFAPLIAPEDQEMVSDHFQKCINGEVQHYTTRGITAKGNSTIANITNVPIIVNDEIIGVYAIVKDFTEKFEAEQQLKELNTQLKTAQKISKIAYLHQDLPDGAVYWSEELFNLLGLENNETSTDHEQFLMFVHPEDQERVFQEIKAFYDEPKSTEVEFRIVPKDGKVKEVIFRSVLIKDTNGNSTKLEGIFQDITEQKQNEYLLKKLNEQLNKKAEELTRVNAELEQFAYVASHDLKEPLRMINGFLQMLQKKYGKSLDETANTYINYALDGSKRMQQLITDLLRYSQITKEDDKKKLVDLNKIYDEVKLNLIKQIEENNATVVIKNSLPILNVNRSAILRLFQNLINNAIKFRKPDEDPVVIIDAKEAKSHWTFSISDNGIGISEENFQKIFEIFSRLHLKTDYPGSGIGLAKCKKIVQHHNGDIWVKSEPGKGSTFYFTLEKTKETVTYH